MLPCRIDFPWKVKLKRGTVAIVAIFPTARSSGELEGFSLVCCYSLHDEKELRVIVGSVHAFPPPEAATCT